MKIYAFWKYDQYPYLLGDEVLEIEGMKVKPANYGGYWFTAKFFLPDDSGAKLKEKLKDLKEKRQNELHKFNEKFDSQLGSLLKEYGQDTRSIK